MNWRERAACREVDPELFFPPTGDKYAAVNARQVCAGCLVREQCLDWAIDAAVQHGIFGGLNKHERNAVRAERRRVQTMNGHQNPRSPEGRRPR